MTAAMDKASVCCARCEASEDLPVSHGYADIAALDGWEFATDTGWLCPDCATKGKSEK